MVGTRALIRERLQAPKEVRRLPCHQNRPKKKDLPQETPFPTLGQDGETTAQGAADAPDGAPPVLPPED